MLAAGSLVSSATAIRVGLGFFELLAERTPPLVRLAAEASLGRRDRGTAQAAFRDDVIALAWDSAEISWREMRRGVDELDAFTRPREQQPRRPQRPYRVKL